MPNGITTATQLRAIAEISGEFGKGFADITTRQQIQLRWFTINDVPQILKPPLILPSVRAIRFRTSRSSKRAPCECARSQIFRSRITKIDELGASLVGAGPSDFKLTSLKGKGCLHRRCDFSTS